MSQTPASRHAYARFVRNARTLVDHLRPRSAGRVALGALGLSALAVVIAAGPVASRVRAARRAERRAVLPPLPGDTSVVYGPRTFTTPNGSQTVNVEQFNLVLQSGVRYLLRIVNGDAGGALRATSGSVTLNGATIVSSTELASGSQTITKEINATATDTIGVTIAGSAGAHVVASVLTTADPTVTIFGPATYVRPSGQSNPVTNTFALPTGVGAPFTLYVANGDSAGNSRASSADLLLNGVAQLTTNDFNQQVGSLVRTVTLTASNTISVKLESSPGNTLVARIVGMDIAPPTLTIAAPAPSSITKNTTVTVSGTVTDQTALKLTINGVAASISSGGYSASVPLPNEGDNVIHVIAVDAAGNTTDSTRTVVRDTEAPALTIAAPTSGFVTRFDTIFVSGSVTDAHAVTVTANGVPLPVDQSDAFTGSVPLVDGSNFITIVATDAAGNAMTIVRNGTRDNAPPVVTLAAPADGSTTQQATVTVSGTVQDGSAVTVKVNGTSVPVTNGSFSTDVPLVVGSNTITILATDAAGNLTTVSRSVTRQPAGPPLPPDPSTVAPALNTTVATTPFTATAFLYTGTNPIQTGVAPGTIRPLLAGVVRGQLLSRTAGAFSGARVSIVSHPEFGQTITRADGFFDLAVNGGEQLTVRFEKSGYLPVERKLPVAWQEYATLDPVAMVPLDSVSTVIDFSSPAQVARGSATSDARGTRRATLVFEQGTTATLVMSDGSVQPAGSLTIRATEYTVGNNGPLEMPAELPPHSAYTYAVELSADEANAANAASVHFDKPVAVYVDNFLRFPTGGIVPVGYYDRARGAWIASANGRVVQILSVTGGIATLDVDGSGQAASSAALTALGLDAAELARLAEVYAPGQSLWRFEVEHFSPWDANWPPEKRLNAITPNPVGAEKRKLRLDKQCAAKGSIIGCEKRTLGEVIGITGAPFALVHQSERVQGFAENYHLDLDLGTELNAEALHDLTAIVTHVSVAGRTFADTFPPVLNQRSQFIWDGKDAYGRRMQGLQHVSATLEYVYVVGRAYGAPPATPFSFGLPAADTLRNWPPSGALFSTYVALADTYIGGWDNRAAGLGGWALSPQHVYDAIGQTIYLGDGTQRSALSINSVLRTVAGNGVRCEGPTCFTHHDGEVATAVPVNPDETAFGPDGTIYMVDGNLSVVYAIAPDGTMRKFAGNGSTTFSGDGGPATNAGMGTLGIRRLPDGSILLADQVNHRLRRVDRNGIITTIAGTGVCGDAGDGGPAFLATICFPQYMTVVSDGTIYFSNGNTSGGSGSRIRRITPAGIISTFAGRTSGNCFYTSHTCHDSLPARDMLFGSVRGLAPAPDGSLYVVDGTNRIVWNVARDGIVRRVAGDTNTFGGDASDGRPALVTALGPIDKIAVGPDGSMYTGGIGNLVRRIGADGIVTTVAGSNSCPGPCFSGDGAAATQTAISFVTGLSFGPDKRLYISELVGRRLRRIDAPLPGLAENDQLVPAEDGSALYKFDSSGRHLATIDALTGVTQLAFAYNTAGLLTSITDANGNVTHVERSPDGTPTAIVSADGDRTTLTTDANGYLATVTNDASERVQLTHTSSGLLTRLVDPRNGEHRFTYTTLGTLVTDQAPDSAMSTLDATTGPPHHSTQTTAEGRTTSHDTSFPDNGTTIRTTISPSGLSSKTLSETNGRITLTTPQGVTTTTIPTVDPRFAMQSPLMRSLSVRMPSGSTLTTTASRAVNLSNPNDPLSLTSQIDSVSVNGNVSVTTFNRVARTITSVTPEGRIGTIRFDAVGRPVEVQRAGVAPITTTYDARGRVATVTQAGRTTLFAYGANGRISQITDPIGRVTRFTYDAAGRRVSTRRPDGDSTRFAYDANGNLTNITPAGRTAHSFSFTAGDLAASYSPPAVGGPATSTSFVYNRDRQLTQITRPDGLALQRGYDAAGRPLSYTRPDGLTTFEYGPTTGLLTRVVESGDGGTLAYTYDGSLIKTITTTGAAATDVSLAYTNEFSVSSVGIHGDIVALAYDRDGLLASAGALTVGRAAATGQVVSTTVGGARDTITYNALGSLAADTARVGGALVYGYQVERDSLERITARTETIDGVQSRIEYKYDILSRLIEVRRDGVVTGTYVYDANGNRTQVTTPSGTLLGAYDAQDRLVSYGAATYAYTAAGELTRRVVGTDTTQYRYDALGMLRGVTLSNGTRIDYTLDALRRRVARSVNGTVVQRFAYVGGVSPAAEIDASGAVVTRFVYGTRVNVPDYLVRGGVTYKLVTDPVGSVRVVVDEATGAIAQELDYDEFGRVTRNTQPGFQPFGFAGGLYDEATGLVRFGARDYDPAIGRWTSKDPIGFAGGDANLYAYGLGDPVNRIDADGRCPICLVILGRAVGGAAADFGMQLLLNGGNVSCVDWARVAETGILAGALGGPGELSEILSEIARLGRAVDELAEGFGATPEGRPFTKHYGTETGPVRNIPGSVVDHVIDTIEGVPGRNSTTVYYDPANDVTVVTGDGGSIVSARRGPP